MNKNMLLLFVIAISSVIGCTNNKPNHEVIPEGWKEINSDKGGFSILFPDYLIEEGSSSNLWNGREVEVMYYRVITEKHLDANVSYGVDYSFHPEVKTDEEIDNGFEEQKKHVLLVPNTTLLNEYVRDSADYKCREMFFLMADQKLCIRYKLLFRNEKLYKLVVVSKQEEMFNKSASKFINSFVFTFKKD